MTKITTKCVAKSPLCTITPQKLHNYAAQCDLTAGVITSQSLRRRSYGIQPTFQINARHTAAMRVRNTRNRMQDHLMLNSRKRSSLEIDNILCARLYRSTIVRRIAIPLSKNLRKTRRTLYLPAENFLLSIAVIKITPTCAERVPYCSGMSGNNSHR